MTTSFDKLFTDGIPDNDSCSFCEISPDDPGNLCSFLSGDRATGTKYLPTLHCTRREGHPGPHVACGIDKHPIAVWDSDAGWDFVNDRLD